MIRQKLQTYIKRSIKSKIFRFLKTRRDSSNIKRSIKNKILKFLKPTRGLANNYYDKKIFCVGNNKTGTNSMRIYFQNLGYLVAPQAEAEKIFLEYYYNNKPKFLKLIIDYINCYEVFQDLPFSESKFLKDLINNFPNEKFIYTKRDSFKQYISLVNHLSQIANFKYDLKNKKLILDKKVVAKKLQNYVWNGHSMLQVIKNRYNLENNNQIFDQEIFMKYQQDHEKNGKKLLSNLDVLFLDLQNKNSSNELSKFLNLPKKFFNKIPHANSRKYGRHYQIKKG